MFTSFSITLYSNMNNFRYRTQFIYVGTNNNYLKIQVFRKLLPTTLNRNIMLRFCVYTNNGNKYGASGIVRINIRSDQYTLASVIRQLNITNNAYPPIIFTIEDDIPYVYLSRFLPDDQGTWILTEVFNTWINDTVPIDATAVASISTKYSEKIIADIQ